MAAKKDNKGLTRLIIKLNGDTPGLKDHRLSIDAFQGSFDALLKAARRIASGIITQAIDNTDYGTGGGKYAQEASRLDLQIASVGEGSDTQIELVLDVKPPYQKGLLEEHDLIFRVGEEIVEAVRDESQGKLRNARIKTYLESLHSGLTSQTYELWRNGKRVGKPVEVGKLEFSEATITGFTPYIQEITGKLVGLTFAPEKPSVRIRYMAEPEDGDEKRERTLLCSASESQVETAVGLRHDEILAEVVNLKSDVRLLHIQKATAKRKAVPPPEKIAKELLKTWDETLAILAE